MSSIFSKFSPCWTLVHSICVYLGNPLGDCFIKFSTFPRDAIFQVSQCIRHASLTRSFPGKLGGQHIGPPSPHNVPPSAISVLSKHLQNRWHCNSFLPVYRQKAWADSMIYGVRKLTCALNMTDIF